MSRSQLEIVRSRGKNVKEPADNKGDHWNYETWKNHLAPGREPLLRRFATTTTLPEKSCAADSPNNGTVEESKVTYMWNLNLPVNQPTNDLLMAQPKNH